MGLFYSDAVQVPSNIKVLLYCSLKKSAKLFVFCVFCSSILPCRLSTSLKSERNAVQAKVPSLLPLMHFRPFSLTKTFARTVTYSKTVEGFFSVGRDECGCLAKAVLYVHEPTDTHQLEVTHSCRLFVDKLMLTHVPVNIDVFARCSNMLLQYKP